MFSFSSGARYFNISLYNYNSYINQLLLEKNNIYAIKKCVNQNPILFNRFNITTKVNVV